MDIGQRKDRFDGGVASDGELEVQFAAVLLEAHRHRQADREGALFLPAPFDGERDGAFCRREAGVRIAHGDGLLALRAPEGDDQASYRLGRSVIDRHCVGGGSQARALQSARWSVPAMSMGLPGWKILCFRQDVK